MDTPTHSAHLDKIVDFAKSHGNNAYILAGVAVAIEIPYQRGNEHGVDILTAMTIGQARNILGY
jgi:hypothetical protein